MGVVYLAEQQYAVHREVALKVLKAGLDTAAVLGRFEAERQALALMEHPNVNTPVQCSRISTVPESYRNRFGTAMVLRSSSLGW
jgi:hypothetical protein